MTDEQTPDQSSSNPEDQNPLGDFDSVDDLDKILAEAASLASDISLEVGESTADSDVSDNAVLDTDHAGDVAAQLDEELAALEELVSSTTDELGTPTDEPKGDETQSEAEPASVDAPSEEKKPPAVPPVTDATSTDDSSEPQEISDKLTPDSPDESSAESITAQPEIESKTAVDEISETPQDVANPQAPVIIQSPKPGVVGTGIFATGMQEHEEEDFEEDEQPVKPKWIKVLDEKISPAALAVCNRSAKILDIVDDRIGEKISEPMKIMVGWAALATIGTAFIVYILSFFWTP